MFTRRNLRLKVLQQLYAIRYNPDTELKAHKKYLSESLISVRKVYTYSLLWISKIADQVLDDKSYREKKNFPNASDKRFTTKLYDNPFIVALRDLPEMKKAIEEYRLMTHFDQDIVTNLYKKLSKDPKYQKYVASPDRTISSNRNIILHIWKKIITPSDLWASHISERWISWNDDRGMLINGVIGTINDFFSERFEESEGFSLKKFDWDDANDFTTRLLDKTLERDESHQKTILPILKNWEADRINPIDNIILKMALSELLFFEDIPVKVTMNEYIELSKIYSTPKSKDFVNGVLDTARKRLEKKGDIVKLGRGLSS